MGSGEGKKGDLRPGHLDLKEMNWVCLTWRKKTEKLALFSYLKGTHEGSSLLGAAMKCRTRTNGVDY